MCACFKGWQKAFDRENWTELMQILKGISMNWRERRCISLQYVEQSVHLRLEHGKKTSVKIGTGVREGCFLLPVLFNFQSEYLIQEVLEGFEVFKTGEQATRTVKYRDDIVLLAREETVLQDKIDRLTEIGRCYGMEINVEKARRRESQSNHPQYRRQIKSNRNMWKISTTVFARVICAPAYFAHPNF